MEDKWKSQLDIQLDGSKATISVTNIPQTPWNRGLAQEWQQFLLATQQHRFRAAIEKQTDYSFYYSQTIIATWENSKYL